MSSYRIQADQFGHVKPRLLVHALAIAVAVVVTILALVSLHTGQAPQAVPTAQAAPGSQDDVGYFPDRFAPIKGDIEPPIEQF